MSLIAAATSCATATSDCHDTVNGSADPFAPLLIVAAVVIVAVALLAVIVLRRRRQRA